MIDFLLIKLKMGRLFKRSLEQVSESHNLNWGLANDSNYLHVFYVKTVENYFRKGYDYGGKADLSKTYWNVKRKMWVTTHFLEIIKQP